MVRAMLAGLVGWAAVMLQPIQAHAEEWKLSTFDDGSFFSAFIRPTSGAGLALLCGERSPRGVSPSVTGNMEPDITLRDTFRINLSAQDIGEPDGITNSRQDVLVVVGTTGHRLPPIHWNELYGTWQTDLAATDPVFSIIAANPSFELRSASTSRIVSASGFGTALASLTSHCQSMFTSIGLPWGSITPAPPPRLSMRQIAESSILTGCGGPAIKGPNTFLSGDIDGDTLTDVVVDWAEITCSGGYPRPFCGASMCSVRVYLSSNFPRFQKPEELLALGVRIQPLSNGNMGIATGGSLSMCQGRGTNGCEFIWYWNGVELVVLN